MTDEAGCPVTESSQRSKNDNIKIVYVSGRRLNVIYNLYNIMLLLSASKGDR